jgi:4'-phosphopantetheinyl transferase
MVAIYFVDTEKIDKKMFPSFLELLPEQQKDDVLLYTPFKTRVSVLFGKLLVLRYFTKQVPHNNFIINKNKFGKPFIEGNIQFNISHSANIVAAAFSENEIGLDVERVQARKQYLNIARRFFCAEEYQYIKGSTAPADAFYHIWTRKEALLKAMGTGLDEALSTYNCINDIARPDGEVSWHIQSFTIKNGFKAAFCQNAPVADWKLQELPPDDFMVFPAR